MDAASAEKIDQEQAQPSGKRTSYNGGENLQRAAGQLQRGESLRSRGQKLVGDGCLVKVVVVVQVGREQMGTNFVVVLSVVFEDEGSLERDVSAANRRARVEDRDCWLCFLR